jgi:hypothetical protein
MIKIHFSVYTRVRAFSAALCGIFITALLTSMLLEIPPALAQEAANAWLHRQSSARNCVTLGDVADTSTDCSSTWNVECRGRVVCSEAGTLRIRESGDSIVIGTNGACQGADPRSWRPSCYFVREANDSAPPVAPTSQYPSHTCPNGNTCGTGGSGWCTSTNYCTGSYDDAKRMEDRLH